MTIKTLTVNGKDISALDSKETTELVRALLVHRKELNESARITRAAARADKKAAAAKRRAEQIKKTEERLAKLKAAA